MVFVQVLITIPARNEAAFIGSCIQSLQNQRPFGADSRILVVDNGSTDGTPQIAAALDVAVVSYPAATIGAVRNVALQDSPNASLYAFIDADCEAPPDWLASTIGYLSDQSVAAIGGYIRCPADANWIQRAWSLPKQEEYREADTLPTGSLIVRGDVLRNLGGFNENIAAGEDTELCSRIRSHGGRLIKAPSLSVVHYGYPSTVRSFLHRQVWQSTDYLLTNKGRVDPVFWLTHIFAISCLTTILGTMTLSAKTALLGIGTALLSSVSLGIYRYLKSDAKLSLRLFIQVVTLNFLYLLGRSVGLVRSYSRQIQSFVRDRILRF
jgi:cellulose synthase/poly-beta-1,6-N-acetylglucosamine synthase-like glycosyltransferase